MSDTDESKSESPAQMTLMRSFPFAILLGGLLYFYEIPFRDFTFAIAFSLYILIADAVRFDFNRPAKSSGVIFDRLQFAREDEDSSRSFFINYVQCFAFCGVLMPIIILMVPDSKSETANIAAPHLFLLLSQILLEHTVASLRCHGYVMCLVPIGFSLYRHGALLTWVTEAYDLHKTNSDGGNWQTQAGLALAVVNNIMWTYNTFVFLLLRMMPVYIDSERFPIAKVDWKVTGLVPVLNSSKQIKQQ